MTINKTYTDGSHNLLFALNEEKWMADLDKSGKASIVGYQEAGDARQRSTLAAWHKKKGRQIFHPAGVSTPIGWDPKVFRPVENGEGEPFRGYRRVHPSAREMGVQLKYDPSRTFTWVGLEHIATKNRVLRINVHPVAAATLPENAPSNKFSAQENKWKDWAAGQYWLDVLAFSAKQISRPASAKSMKPYWDAVTIGGDYNAAMNRRERWYYPAAMLAPMFKPDTVILGLDHLQVNHGGDLVPVKRWSVTGYTDHRIHFVSRKWAAVQDFQRQR